MLNINFNPFPILETTRLSLRQLHVNDAAQMFAMRSSEEVMKYIARARAKTVEDAVQLINKMNGLIDANEAINFGIALKDSNELIGTIALFNFKKEHYRCELGYLLSPAFHRQGIMNEAIQEILAFGFNKLQLHSIEAVVDPQNIASISLLEKHHFIKEAYFKEDCYYEGKFLDSVIYSLLKS